MDIGRRIREVREDLGMPAAVLARRVGVAPNTIWRYEVGEREPSMAMLGKIARELRVEPAALVQEPTWVDVFGGEVRPAVSGDRVGTKSPHSAGEGAGRAPVPLDKAPQGPPQVSHEDLAVLGVTATDPELKELNNELASYWHLWVRRDKTAYAYVAQENVDKKRVWMLMHLVLDTPSIITPEAASVVRQGMKETLKAG